MQGRVLCQVYNWAGGGTLHSCCLPSPGRFDEHARVGSFLLCSVRLIQSPALPQTKQDDFDALALRISFERMSMSGTAFQCEFSSVETLPGWVFTISSPRCILWYNIRTVGCGALLSFCALLARAAFIVFPDASVFQCTDNLRPLRRLYQWSFIPPVRDGDGRIHFRLWPTLTPGLIHKKLHMRTRRTV